MLNADMKRVLEEQRLGFVATVSADGTPNLSPKATMLVLDDEHIAFGDIRSPNTIANLLQRPALEINFVDPFARKGYRFKGEARYVERGSDEFARLLPGFEAIWGELCARFMGIVVMSVERAAPLVSPAYDRGVSEEELRAKWKAYYANL
ncbi:MAG: pyridoxamine 5'-phosphate oxidase family protein [Gammaproteobacteria bacterium]